MKQKRDYPLHRIRRHLETGPIVSPKHPKTIHYRGNGKIMAAGGMIGLPPEIPAGISVIPVDFASDRP